MLPVRRTEVELEPPTMNDTKMVLLRIQLWNAIMDLEMNGPKVLTVTRMRDMNIWAGKILAAPAHLLAQC